MAAVFQHFLVFVDSYNVFKTRKLERQRNTGEGDGVVLSAPKHMLAAAESGMYML